MPLIHSKKKIAQLFETRTEAQRTEFYETHWNTLRWNLLFRVFFSRRMMARLGRDPSFFRYVEGSVAERILGRARHALTVLDPIENPYLQWILTEEHPHALPFALRPENFEPIRDNLDRLEWRRQSLEDYLAEAGEEAVDGFNLSDIFEYMSEENYTLLLEKLIRAGRPGARLAYWNMLVPRRRPESLADLLRPLGELAADLHLRDRAFFYSAFVVEEIL